MCRCTPLMLGVLLVLRGTQTGKAELKPTALDSGKKATALVEVSSDRGRVSGSAFCVDKSGLFITNAHVVADTTGKLSKIGLVLDSGLATQRTLPAKVLRIDSEVDLALLQARPDPNLTPLALGRDADLRELAEITTFGYPYGKEAAASRGQYPEITVLPSRITSLRSEKGRLVAVQFDNQINPGNSGGPVLDNSGRVVGVAMATVQGAALNRAIPVGWLAEFLATPGLVFEIPPIPYETCTKPVTWTIEIKPPTPAVKLPKGLSVSVTVKGADDKPRAFTAKAVKDGTFQATVIPNLHLDLHVRESKTRKALFGAYLKDGDVRVGGKTFRLSDLDLLMGGSSPHVRTRKGEVIRGKVPKLSGATRMGTNSPVTIDLGQPIEISVQKEALIAWSMPMPTIEALVEVKQGSKVVAALRQRRVTTVTPVAAAQPMRPVRSGFQMPSDEGLLMLGGVLESDGRPRGAGQAIQPPQATIPAAQLSPGGKTSTEASLTRRVAGTISDVAVGGGGRYLLLTLKDIRKLAVFDVNAADVVKMINLPSRYALVAAGAKKVLIVFPDERLLQRWDLATLKRDVNTRRSPIRARVLRLAMGSDSDGPALAYWQEERGPGIASSSTLRFSFVDLDALTVLKVGSIDPGANQGDVSASGGSFTSDWTLRESIHLRPSSGGALFGIWETGATRCRSLSVHSGTLTAVAFPEYVGYVVAGPDGQTLFTGAGRRLDTAGKPIGHVDQPGPPGSQPMIVPSPEPAYYLAIRGLSAAMFDPNGASSQGGPVTASIHSAGDGSSLLTVHGLDEMSNTVKKENWHYEDFTADKRFHFVPAARLLITIPPTNDRLVLRQVSLDGAVDRALGDRLAVTSSPNAATGAGREFEHQIVARSKKGGITYGLARGPQGLDVSPDGKVTWTVPKTLKGKDVSAVITIGDASGQEVFHTLKIHVD